MDDIKKIQEELETLPKGYISKKKIHGKVYHYLQRREQDRVKSTYVKEQDLEEVMRGIERRKELEAMLDQLLGVEEKPVKTRKAPKTPKAPKEIKATEVPEPSVEIKTTEIVKEPVQEPISETVLEPVQEPIQESAAVEEITPEPIMEPVPEPIVVEEPKIEHKPVLEKKPESSKVLDIDKVSRELTGSIMLGDKAVATFVKGGCTSIDKKLCPLELKRTEDLVGFLSARAMDRSRPNATILRNLLGLSGKEDYVVSLYSYGATVTDPYWFKPSGMDINYQDIAFDKDYCCDISLKGDDTETIDKNKITPQLTVVGTHEKCWKKIGEDWWLYKKETEDEAFSEIISCKLASFMGIPSTHYFYENGGTRSKNFTVGYIFEPMTSVAGNDNSYVSILNKLSELPAFIQQQYLRLIAFDAIVNHKDRKNTKLGFLRDPETGKILRLAPNFGNNRALIGESRDLVARPEMSEQIVDLIKFVRTYPEIAKMYKEMVFPELKREDIATCILATPIKRPEIDFEGYIYKRYEYLRNALRN